MSRFSVKLVDQDGDVRGLVPCLSIDDMLQEGRESSLEDVPEGIRVEGFVTSEGVEDRFCLFLEGEVYLRLRSQREPASAGSRGKGISEPA